MRAACIQLRSGIDIPANIRAASDLIRAAAADGAAFIATPEMTHILQRSPKRLFAQIKPEEEDPGVAAFSALAQELRVDLLIGSLAIKTGDQRAANRSFHFGPDGNIKARYDKIHLFDVQLSRKETWKESNVYDRGETAVISNIEETIIGLSVCYDVRFPDLYRHYAKSGAHILTVPAAFTRPTGEAHWHTLLKARAIETGSFVLAPAQGGAHEDGRETFGHSVIIGPWGDIRVELKGNEPGIICADIDIADSLEARRKIPAWNHNPGYSL